MKKLLAFAALLLISTPIVRAAEKPYEPTPEVKKLMIQGLEAYIGKHYLKAMELFDQVLVIAPKWDLALQYETSSRQRIDETEMVYDIEHSSDDYKK